MQKLEKRTTLSHEFGVKLKLWLYFMDLNQKTNSTKIQHNPDFLLNSGLYFPPNLSAKQLLVPILT